MTKKEVAKEIFDSYYWELENDYKAKQCALISVELLIKYEGEWYDSYYWKAVKEEIINI